MLAWKSRMQVLRRPARAGAVALFALGALVGLATPAGAHASLESSDPAPGERLATAPTDVVLRFTEGVEMPPNGATLFDSACEPLETGVPVVGASSAEVKVPLPDLRDGAYVMSWRVVSDDGHPVQGALTFSVGSSVAAPDCDAEPAASSSLGALAFMVRWLGFVTLFAVVGVPLGWVLLGRPGASARVRRLWAATVAIAAVLAALSVPVLGARALGGDLSSVFGSDAWSEGLDLRGGPVALARLGLLILFAPFGWLLLGGRRHKALLAAGALIGVAILTTPGLAGHAATGPEPEIALPLDVVHLAAAALWLGGLVALAVLLVRDAPVEPVARFSRLALASVVVIVGTGAVQSIRQLGEFAALWETSYGRLLALKLLFVGVMLTLASASRDITRREVVPAAGDQNDARRRLRQAVVGEILAGMLVLGATAALVNAPPGRVAEQQASVPYHAVLTADGYEFEVHLEPGAPGPNNLAVHISDPDGAPVEAVEVTAGLAEPEREIAPIPLVLEPSGIAGSYSTSVDVPLPGTWRLEIRALVSDVDEVAAVGTVPVR